MSRQRKVFDELTRRIENEIKYYNGKLPNPSIMAWHGYLAALIEWSVISIQEHAKLTDLILPTDDILGGEDALEGISIGRGY